MLSKIDENSISATAFLSTMCFRRFLNLLKTELLDYLMCLQSNIIIFTSLAVKFMHWFRCRHKFMLWCSKWGINCFSEFDYKYILKIYIVFICQKSCKVVLKCLVSIPGLKKYEYFNLMSKRKMNIKIELCLKYTRKSLLTIIIKF